MLSWHISFKCRNVLQGSTKEDGTVAKASYVEHEFLWVPEDVLLFQIDDYPIDRPSKSSGLLLHASKNSLMVERAAWPKGSGK